jgi:hypothetical protein
MTCLELSIANGRITGHTSLLAVSGKLSTWIRRVCFNGLVLLALFLPSKGLAQDNLPVNLPAMNECTDYVWIEGSTNINRFAFFQQLKFGSKDQISLGSHKSQLRIDIPANNFEASNPLMYADFLKLIKAEDHPFISITIYYNPKDLVSNTSKQLNSIIEVKLAGNLQCYSIPGTLHVCHDRSLRVNGSIKINLNDFQLEPPTKFFGMVKVNQEVFVNFGLTMENNLLTKN